MLAFGMPPFGAYFAGVSMYSIKLPTAPLKDLYSVQNVQL
tara:strand:+ start:453 stop:572 length:120 start_codon:yes stop_codon:yes gene_type:complete